MRENMTYLRRKADDFLKNWKLNTDRKPLIVKGPRQIGKTESIRKFGAENYKEVIEINFVEEPKYRLITENGYRTADIIKNISRIDPSKKFAEGETLLFFDELQAFPEIATALKFFCQDGRFDVICSGSMPGINYNRIERNSIGYKEDYQMYSFDFEEFLWAKGYDDSFTEDMFAHMMELTPFHEGELALCQGLFLDFCILGGMPAVLREYVAKGTFEGSLGIQRQILADYEEDVRKYAGGPDQGEDVECVSADSGAACEGQQKISDIEGSARCKIQGLQGLYRVACGRGDGQCLLLYELSGTSAERQC